MPKPTHGGRSTFPGDTSLPYRPWHMPRLNTAVCSETSLRLIDPEVAIASSQRCGPVDLNPIELAVSKRKSPLADSGNGLTITRGSTYTT